MGIVYHPEDLSATRMHTPTNRIGFVFSTKNLPIEQPAYMGKPLN